MALLNVFKKSKKEEKEKDRELEKLAPDKKTDKKKVLELTKKEEKEPIVKVKDKSNAWLVLKSPRITEKAMLLAENNNQYTFNIWPKANKTEVKKAIESLYDVKVEWVRIIPSRKKVRRRGLIEGFKRVDKKAIVKLKEGQKIEVLPR